MPRAPNAPVSPTSAPSLDSSSDSPSSYTSSRLHHEYPPFPDMSSPEIVDGGGYTSRYTGAYYRGQSEHWLPSEPTPMPPKNRPIPPPVAVPRPAVPNMMVADPQDPQSPPPPPAGAAARSPTARGGPKAGMYLAANAPPPEPEVVEVKTAEPSTPLGPTAIESRQVVPLYPPNYGPYPPSPSHHHSHPHSHPHHPHYHHHPHHPAPPWSEDDGEGYPPYDDEEESEGEDDEERSWHSRRSGRPRQHIRHVEARMRSHSRPRHGARSRSRPRRQVAEPEARHRRRSRSRPRHHSHHSHHPHNHYHHHHHRHQHRSKSRPRARQPDKVSAELQAQIEQVTIRLSNIMDDPYAKEIIAKDNIKFEALLKEAAEVGAAATAAGGGGKGPTAAAG